MWRKIPAIYLTEGEDMTHKMNLQDKYFDFIKNGTKRIELLKYQDFKTLFNDFGIEILADKTMTKEELLGILSEFYTPEKQEKFGVLGIRVEL